MFKGMTIGKKIGLGFGAMMVLLAVVGVLSYTGVGRIVENASEVITGNKLDGNLAQKEVDHLNWANQVSALLTDENVTTLNVETDDHKCAFGEWLYGEGRKEAEKQIPSIAPLLKEIEGYHADLHKSAIAIGQHFKQADATVPGTLAAREVDHLVWADQVNQLFLENLPQLNVQTDPTKCGLGKWLDSDEVKKLVAADPEFGRLLEAIKEPHAKLHTSAIDIQKAWKQQHEGLVNTLQARLDDHRKWAAGVCGALLNNKKVEVEIDPAKCVFGKWLAGDECRQLCAQWPEFAQIIDKVKGHHDKLHASADHIGKEWKKVHPGLTHTLQARLDDHRKWAASVCGALLNNEKVEVETDPHKCAFGKWLDGEECQQLCAQWPAFAGIIEKVKGPHDRLHASALKIGEAADQNAKAEIYQQETMVELEQVGKLFAQVIALEEQNVEGSAKASEIYQTVTYPELRQVATLFGDVVKIEAAIVEAGQHAREILDKQTLPALGHTREAIHKCREHATHALDGMAQANQVFAAQTKPNLEKTQERLNKIRQEVKANVMTDEVMLAAAQGTKRNVTVVGIIAIILGALLAFFIARGIVKTLTRIIVGLNEGADQVNDAAAQVSSASQQLAEGASEQASSLEETSSALEQMAAMTRTNAENTKEANNLSSQARDAAQGGDKTMHQLNEAMTAINVSSGQISKIIKVIEEIAFQTNLLALNAAVEAARAGEHGKGFAVVADEVRNLAQRSAQAARETTELIESSVNNAKEGTEVAGKVGTALGAIVGDVTKVTALIDGISKASDEQAQGVDQVNTAVSQMDKVTQQNASGAEESASAAEELSAQAATVKSMVDELAAMVGGSNARTGPSAPMAATPKKPKKRLNVKVGHLKKNPPARPEPERVTAATPSGGAADDFMSLDDKNLEGF